MDVDDILDNLGEILTRKESFYGSSFSKTFNEYGLLSLIIRLNDKLNRLKSLYSYGIAPNDNSVVDTLVDMSGYCILGLREIEKNEYR